MTAPQTIREHAEAILAFHKECGWGTSPTRCPEAAHAQAILDALDEAPTFAMPGRLTPGRLVPDPVSLPSPRGAA